MSGTCYDVLYCSDTDDEKKRVTWATPLENIYSIPARETPPLDWHEEYNSDELESEWEFTPSPTALCGGEGFVANSAHCAKWPDTGQSKFKFE